MRKRPPHGWTVVPFAALGLAIGHLLVYLIAIPGTAARDAFLDHTGHAYFPAFGQVALVVGVVALVASVLTALGRRPASTVRGGLFRRLAPVQAVAFVVLETIERLTAHASLADLVHRNVVLGIVLQLMVAGCISLLVATLRRAARTALTPVAHRARWHAVVRLVPSAARPAGRDRISTRWVRGPPLVLPQV